MRSRFGRVYVVVLAVGLAGGCANDEPWKTEPPVVVPALPTVSEPAPGAVALPWQLQRSEPAGQLVLVVPGADCRTPTGAQVASTVEAVTVTVWGTERSACRSGRRVDNALVTVRLPEPLNGRRLEHGG